jgi:threonine dehydrogenase-like Zn-dependent dehydrogenase
VLQGQQRAVVRPNSPSLPVFLFLTFLPHSCPKQVDTYNAEEGDGVLTQGGYATHIRSPESFVFHVPEGLDLADAAPMACGGLTAFSPMVRFGVKKGTKMAVAGLGTFSLPYSLFRFSVLTSFPPHRWSRSLRRHVRCRPRC